MSDKEMDRLKHVIDHPGLIDQTVQVRFERSNSVVVEASDQEKLFLASNMVKALSLGFSFDESRGLMNAENYLLMVPLRTELPPRDRRKKTRSISSRSRLFAFESLNLRVIEKFTGVAFKLRDDNLWLIGPIESAVEASREVRQIIMGRTRGTVQQYHRGKRGIPASVNGRKLVRVQFIRLPRDSTSNI